jgi:predicted DCC family thiol-disulfide oxidoreductase YuxK
MANTNNIVLFDGVCNLCNATVYFIIKRDKKELFKFASLQSKFGLDITAKTSPNQKGLDTIFYIRENKQYKRSTAALYILKDLGNGWQVLFYSLIWIPWFIRDLGYRFISSIRYRVWGKKDSCMVPSPDLKARFLA